MITVMAERTSLRNLVFIGDEAGVYHGDGPGLLALPGTSRKRAVIGSSQSVARIFRDWGTQFRWLDCFNDPQRQRAVALASYVWSLAPVSYGLERRGDG